MNQFNYDSYMRDNPLMKETSGYGNYTDPETMLEKEDYVSSDEYDYMTSDETDDAEKTGKLSPHNAPLGPDQKMMEGSDKVTDVYKVIIEKVKGYMEKYGLDDEDTQELKQKLSEFFK
jgi:hypothetical protein